VVALWASVSPPAGHGGETLLFRRFAGQILAMKLEQAGFFPQILAERFKR
jgi:hypothetical protein